MGSRVTTRQVLTDVLEDSLVLNKTNCAAIGRALKEAIRTELDTSALESEGEFILYSNLEEAIDRDGSTAVVVLVEYDDPQDPGYGKPTLELLGIPNGGAFIRIEVYCPETKALELNGFFPLNELGSLLTAFTTDLPPHLT